MGSDNAFNYPLKSFNSLVVRFIVPPKNNNEIAVNCMEQLVN